MSKRGSHIQQGLGFIVGCGLVGAFLYIISNDAKPTSERTAQAAFVQASADRAADRLDAQANAEDAKDSVDPNAPSLPSQTVRRSDDVAGRHSNSVFGDGQKGTLLCSFDDVSQFQVDWQTDDQNGSVRVDGRPVNGTVIGDWEPASNKARFDIEINGSKDGKPDHIEIADDGTLNGDGGRSGTCRSAT